MVCALSLLNVTAQQDPSLRCPWYIEPMMYVVYKRHSLWQNDGVAAHIGVTLDVQAAQVVTDFFDELKSRSKGYASMEYTITGYRANDLVRLDVKINNEVRLHIHASFPAACKLHRQALSVVGKYCMRRQALHCVAACKCLPRFPLRQDKATHWVSLYAVACSDSGAAGVHSAPGCSLPRGPQPGEEAQRAHPAAAVPHPHPGCHRLARHCI